MFFSDTFEEIAKSDLPVYSGGTIDGIENSQNPHLMRIKEIYKNYENLDEVLTGVSRGEQILIGSKGYFDYILAKDFVDE